MKYFISLWVILLLIISAKLAYSQSNTKTWTETTTQDFLDNQLTNLVVKSDSGGEAQLQYPLVKTINDYNDNQFYRYTARDSDGDFVRTWVKDGNVFAQKYKADIKKFITAIKVNNGNAVNGIAGKMVALLDNGTYLVVWNTTAYNGGEDFWGQVISNDSVKEGNNFKINDEDTGISGAGACPVANNKDNCFVLFFTLRVIGEDRIYVQTRNVHGNMIGENKRLNNENITQLEYVPQAIVDANGYWVIWTGDSRDISPYPEGGVYMRRYRLDGEPVINPIHVFPESKARISICEDKQSHVFITWLEPTLQGGASIYGQLFDSSGITIGTKIKLNSSSPNIFNQDPDVDLINNEFRVSWLSWSAELDGYVTYVNSWKFDPKLSGEMISSVFDGSPKGCLFDKLSWVYKSNIASDLKFQLRSANTLEQLNNSQWYGPIGSSDFYTNNTEEIIKNIHNGKRYIQYKAYFTSEYGNSAELKSVSISYLSNDVDSPEPPHNLTACNNKINVFLSWEPSTNNDVAVYKIYRGVESQKYDETWCKVVSKEVVTFTDSSALVGKKYYYSVTAIDSSHNESSFSNEALMIFRGSNIYVSANGNPSGSGTFNDPVKTIQQGMDIAFPGDTLKIMPGTYSDKFSYKARVSLIGSGTTQSTLNCEIYPPDDCIVQGFTITKPIHCEQGAPTITENVIKCDGTAIYLSVDGKNYFSSAIITKNFITGCSYGIYARNDVINPTIKNNIINAKSFGIGIPTTLGNPEIINNTIIVTGNESFSLYIGSSQRKVENNICVSKCGVSSGNALSPVTNYNDLWCKVPANFTLSATNILLDPKFVNEDVSDYHLLTNSPCKDSGNPDQIYNDIDGTRNDIGAYGGPDPFNINIISQLTRSIYVSSLSGYPGDTISVSISLDKSSGLAKADFSLEYDNNILNFINAGLTEATSNFNLEHNVISPNEIKFSISSASGTTGISNNILKLNFIINPQSKTNDASQLTLKSVSLIDTTSKSIFIKSITNGAFAVNNTSESENYIYVDSKNSGTEDGSRKHPFKTITSGINKAESGDTVWVSGGDYYDSINMKEGVYLIGSGSSVTNYIGTGDAYGILFNNVTHGEISGFTFKSDNEHLMMSAFIICHSSSPVIKKNRFETDLYENTAVLCEDNSNPLIEDNYFKNSDILVNTSNPFIKNNFVYCFMWGIKCAANSSAQITGNTITGMLDAIQVYQSSAVIKNNIIYCGLGELGITLTNATDTKIYNNIVKDTGNNGRGIRIYECQNTEVINNTILTKKRGIEEVTSISNVFNNIVVNSLEYGIEFSDASLMDYNAFWNNYTNYEGINPGNHNIGGNVLFADTSKENYRLLSNSPCINAGNPEAKYNDIDGSRNDIGAYGGPYADSSWINQSGSTLAMNQVTNKDTIRIIINGEKVEGIAKFNLTLSYDPDILTMIRANSSSLTKSFSVEETKNKFGTLNLVLNSNIGISDASGGLIELYFTSQVLQPRTTKIHFESAAAWDETTLEKYILELKDGELNIMTGVEENNNELPKTYYLSQNYPNPFNTSTKIRFEIPSECKVVLKIYNILGREISTLLNENKRAGSYEVEWNAARFASGVYFITLKAAKNLISRKMVLVK